MKHLLLSSALAGLSYIPLFADIMIDRPGGNTISAKFDEPLSFTFAAAAELDTRLHLTLGDVYSGSSPLAIGVTDASGFEVLLNGVAIPVTGFTSSTGGISGAPVLNWSFNLPSGVSYQVQPGDVLTVGGDLIFSNYLSASQFPDNLGPGKTISLGEGLARTIVATAIGEVRAGLAQSSPEVIQINFGGNDAGVGWNNISQADFNGAPVLDLVDRDGNTTAVKFRPTGTVAPVVSPALVGQENSGTWNGGTRKDWVTPEGAQDFLLSTVSDGQILMLLEGLDPSAKYRVELLSATESFDMRHLHLTVQNWDTFSSQIRRPDTNFDGVTENGNLIGTGVDTDDDFNSQLHGWTGANWVVWEEETSGTVNIADFNGSQDGLDVLPVLLEGGAVNALRLVKIADNNSAPTDLSISTSTLTETQSNGQVIATLSAVDPDAGDALGFSLNSGAGDTDNSDFFVNGASLVAVGAVDFEAQQSYSIRLQVTDSGGLSYEESFVLNVVDDRSEDFDGDGLIEADEEDVYGTSDLLADSDGDSFDDDEEISEGTDPTDPMEFPNRAIEFINVGDTDLGNMPVIAFGEVALSDSKTITLTVENTGNVSVGSLAFAIPGEISDVYTFEWVSGSSLPIGETGDLRISYTPQSATASTGQVEVFSFFNSGEPFGALSVSGNGVAIEALAEAAITDSGLTGADAELDAIPFDDGVSNLAKFAFNMNLTGPDVTNFDPVSGNSGLPTFALDDSGPTPVIRLQYIRRKGAGLIYTPQRTTSLSGYDLMVGTTTVTDLDDDFEKVVVEEPCDPDLLPTCFTRVQVSLPQPPPIQVVDSIDAGVQTIQVGAVGSITTAFTNDGSFWYFGADVGRWRGVNAGGFSLYSSGADIISNTAHELAFISNAAGNGIRYLMLDIDNNGTHETVVETNLVLSSVSTSTITRYAFKEDNTDLEISEALAAFASAP